jgi:hypothetical protein
VFQKIYGSSRSITATDFCISHDSGYLIAANDLQDDFYLIKTDSAGSPQWMKAYGGNYFDWCTSVLPLASGGYVIAGMTASFTPDSNTDFFLMKIDDTGKIQWQKQYGGEENEWMGVVKQTLDGGFVIIGTVSLSAGVKGCLVRTDSLGNLLWGKQYLSAGAVAARCINLLEDGGFLITGSSNDDIFALKVDSLGNTVWGKTFGTYLSEGLIATAQSLSSDLVLAAVVLDTPQADYNIYLIKIDTSGNLKWSVLYKRPGLDDLTNIEYAGDSSFILVGGGPLPGSNKGFILLEKVDGQSHIIWSKAIGRSNSLTDGGNVVKPSAKGFVVAGVSLVTAFSKHKVYLVKTDSTGDAYCGTDTLGFTEVVPATTTDTLVCTTTSFDTSSVNYFTFHSFYDDSTVCFPNRINELVIPKSNFSIFPNPTTGLVTIKAPLPIELVEISNAFGEKVFSTQPKSATATINLQSLPKGIYFYSVKTTNRTERGKIVLQ